MYDIVEFLFKPMQAFLPALITILGAICILISNAFTLKFSRSLSVSLSMLFLLITLTLLVGRLNSLIFVDVFDNYMKVFSHVAQILIVISSFSFIFLTLSKKRFEEFQVAEYYPLYMLSIAGFQIMVSSSNLILIFLGLELGSLPLASMLAVTGRHVGLEAGVKYFVTSAVAGIFFIFGATLIFFYSSSFDLMDVFLFIPTLQEQIFMQPYMAFILILGLLFLLGAIGFKISLVPWHTWMPDIYEGSNPILAGYISIVPKIAGFIVFARIFYPFIDINNIYGISIFKDFFYVLIIITITLPNIMALLQKDVKRMLAFSSISHAGFALACIFLGNIPAMFLYWGLYAVTNIGIFALLWLCRNVEGTWDKRFDHPYEKFQGLVRLHPLLAMLFAIFMLSLAGVPPFAVFWGKISAILSALQAGYIWLGVVMIVNSGIAVYFYLKLIVFMFFKKPIVSNAKLYVENESYAIQIVVGITALLCSLSLIFLGIIDNIIKVF